MGYMYMYNVCTHTCTCTAKTREVITGADDKNNRERELADMLHLYV